MRYRVILQEHRGRRQELEYRLHDTPVVERFVAVTRQALAADARPYGAYFSTRLTEPQFRARLCRMRELIHRVAAGGVWPMPDYRLTPATVTQAQLNHLHRLFHEFEEQCRLPVDEQQPALAAWRSGDDAAYQRTREDLNALNLLIHHIEHAQKSREDWTWQFFGFHLAPQEPLPLHSNDYAAMTAQVKFGDLLLCYGTAGKNLYTCFLDDDLDVVRSGQVRQQVTVSSGVLAAFTTDAAYASSAAYERTQYERYHAWCERNEVIRDGHDHRLPIYRFGNIPLGELVDQSLSWNDVAEILRRYDRVVSVELTPAARPVSSQPAARVSGVLA